ncbi:hypothetical protein Goari_022000 [Gossypium aridum]|uniref:DUF7745 domain-containing protein n=1 Tax=Gossypium aridum TaxID=34290 RepID=A0A7J8YM44_GOSAI|nr:hypothetical protein [Gossypium aridum]
MSKDTQSREGDYQIAYFNSSMDCRRNRKDELKEIWQSWDATKKTHFQDKCFTFNKLDIVPTIKKYSTLLHYDFRDPLRLYWKQDIDFLGPLAHLMGLPSDIRDAMGKANGDRHLALFTFAIYKLIMFPKAIGYVTVLVETIISLNFIRRKGDGRLLGCAQLLFVWMKNHFRCFYKRFRQVFVPSTRPIEEFLESEWPPNQSIKEWVQNLSTLTYQEIEWKAPWMIQSTILIECDGHLWVPLIGIWGAISYSSLMVLSKYRYDQCVPTIAGLNRVEVSIQDPGF